MQTRKPLQRILQLALRLAQPAVWALTAAGIIAFLLLPLTAKKCYLDEKALLVGGAVPTIRQTGALNDCLAAYHQLQPGSDLAALVHAAAAAVPAARGLHFQQYNFSGGSRVGYDGGGSASGSGVPGSNQGGCSTLHTIVRSPRGDGTEGFVLMMPLNASSPQAAALAVAVGVAMGGHLRQSRWLAKDAVLVFTDATCGAAESAEYWMAAYNSAHDLFGFPRAGLLQQALVLELTDAAVASSAPGSTSSAGTAELSVHGSGGQLPNLDLYYLIKRNLDMHTTLPVSLRASAAPLPAAVQQGAAALGAVAAALGLAPAAAAWQYASELQTMAAFSMQLAGGQATGAHAAFLQQQIDAATLTLHLHTANAASSNSGGASILASSHLQLAAYSALAAGEMVLRTFNNLQERLHHSTALYVLVSPDRFASIAVYLAPPACLLLAALAQLVVESRTAAGAAPGVWQTAWRRVAAAHAAALAVGAVAKHALSSGQLGDRSGTGTSMMQPGHCCRVLLAKHVLWAAAAGLAAAVGPPALLTAVWLDSSNAASKAGGSGRQARRCARAVGAATLVLQSAYMLIGQWVQCFAFLLAAVPLYALSTTWPQSGSGRLAAQAGLLCASAAAAWHLQHSTWMLGLLASHILVVATS